MGVAAVAVNPAAVAQDFAATEMLVHPVLWNAETKFTWTWTLVQVRNFLKKKSHHLFGEDLVIVAWLAASIATVAFIDGTWNHMVHISTEMLATQVVLIALWKIGEVDLPWCAEVAWVFTLLFRFL